MRQKVKGSDRASHRPSRSGEPHASLYDSVTSRIVAELEAGRLPWVQPWGGSGGAAAALPHNAHSGRAYSGINILILWGAVIEAGWPSQGWLTFRQALEAGGHVRKGERGTTVVYADRFIPKGEPLPFTASSKGLMTETGCASAAPGRNGRFAFFPLPAASAVIPRETKKGAPCRPPASLAGLRLRPRQSRSCPKPSRP